MSMVLCLRTGALVLNMHTQGCSLVRHVQPFDMCNDSLLRRDYALIAEEEVELAPGLNVVTGESGAGKSVLVTCLGQLLGAPAVENCIRPPASSALIEGTVHLPTNAVVMPCIQIRTHVGCICPAARRHVVAGRASFTGAVTSISQMELSAQTIVGRCCAHTSRVSVCLMRFPA